MSKPIWIAMRSHNDAPVVYETLAALRRQGREFRLLSLDNASSDGTAEAVSRLADHAVPIAAGTYVPGRVLNQAMRNCDGEIVVFLNSDCTPRHDDWLARLLEPFDDSRVGATFGRQVARPGCPALEARDIEDAYGSGSRHERWPWAFSMAASAIRRSAWQEAEFDETLSYSEDIEWAWRCRQRGWTVRYQRDAVVAHSHNYTLRQSYQRQRGEGAAEANFLDLPSWRRTFLRYAVLPYGRRILGDLAWAIPAARFDVALASPLYRLTQGLGRWRGFSQSSVA